MGRHNETMPRIVEMLTEHPEHAKSTSTALRGLYRKEFGKTPGWIEVRKARERYLSLVKAGEIVPTADVPQGMVVSDTLLEQIRHIAVATNQMGGHRAIAGLVTTIEEVGGIENFKRVLNLIRAVNHQAGEIDG